MTMTRLDTPARGRSMVHMIKTLGERLSTPNGDENTQPKAQVSFVERPTPPLPPTHLKTLQRR
jgi:hypothetical protein